MTINEYQKLAMTTLNPELDKKDVLINGVMGLCGESGEVIDIVKKHLAQGHELDKEKIIKVKFLEPISSDKYENLNTTELAQDIENMAKNLKLEQNLEIIFAVLPLSVKQTIAFAFNDFAAAHAEYEIASRVLCECFLGSAKSLS